jgi:hypothetical protein
MMIKSRTKKAVILCLMILTVGSGCKKNEEAAAAADVQETAQQVGDVMASVDESGGNSGTIASFDARSVENTFERFAPGTYDHRSVAQLMMPQAQAAACTATNNFSSCSSNVITRTFGGCTVGSATFNGTVTLTWGGASTGCVMAAANDHVTRVPNFTVTGRRSATLTVTKTATVGQRVTWTSGSGASRVMSFTNDGINRKFTLSGTTLFDQTTSVTSAITVTGTSRTSRVMNGGTLQVVNNLTSVTCSFSPTNVTWTGGTCNCPTSGSWSGTCTDGKSVTLDISGCGTANYTEGSTTTSVSFDRCGS